MSGADRAKPETAPQVSGAAGAPAAAPSRTRREITSAELFDGGREINIRHSDEIYTLRQTSKGKLILTK